MDNEGARDGETEVKVGQSSFRTVKQMPEITGPNPVISQMEKPRPSWNK